MRTIQRKIPLIMESIGFTLYDLYFVINTFKSAGTDRVNAMILMPYRCRFSILIKPFTEGLFKVWANVHQLS